MTEAEGLLLKPGQRVSLVSMNERHVPTVEYGIVISTWQVRDKLGAVTDCYVAFFGDKFPSEGERPTKRPYVLRYYATSLNLEE